MVCVGASREHVPQGLAVCQENVHLNLLLLQQLPLQLLQLPLPPLQPPQPQLHLPQLHQPQLHPPQAHPPQPPRLVTSKVESCALTLSTTCPGPAVARTPAPVSLTRAQYAREPTLPWGTPASVLLKGVWVTVL